MYLSRYHYPATIAVNYATIAAVWRPQGGLVRNDGQSTRGVDLDGEFNDR